MERFGPKQRRRRRGQQPADQFFAEEEEQRRQIQDALEMSLSDAGLSVRTTNTLEAQQIFTIGQLAQRSREQLLEITNFGDQTLEEVRLAVERLHVPHPDWSAKGRR